jgi:hypothetical protein
VSIKIEGIVSFETMPRFGTATISDYIRWIFKLSQALPFNPTGSEPKVPAFLPFPPSAAVDGTAAVSLAYTISNSHHTPFREGLSPRSHLILLPSASWIQSTLRIRENALR